MSAGVTVGTDQQIVFGDCQSLGRHGSTQIRAALLTENLSSGGSKTGNNISSVINFGGASMEGGRFYLWSERQPVPAAL